MARAYSADLRERVVLAIKDGLSRRAAGRLFKVSASSAIRWMESVNTRGRCAAKPTGGDVRSQALEAHKDWLLSLVAREPDLTLGVCPILCVNGSMAMVRITRSAS